MHTNAFITGFTLCASLIIAIGAQNAFVLRQGLRREHVTAIVLFCALMDLILIALGVAGVARILGDAPALTLLLTIGGAAFLSWYGLGALARTFRRATLNAQTSDRTLSRSAAIRQAAGFTFLNPHVYLDTVLLMGSIGAAESSALRPWFVGGAACASGLWFTSLGFGARLLAPLFSKPLAWRVLDAIIGISML